MPGNDELWPEGRAPQRHELLQYLVAVAGLTHEDARQVANRYREPSAASDEPVPLGGGEWNEERLRLWVNAQPEVRQVRGPGGITSAMAQAGGDTRRILAGEPETSGRVIASARERAERDEDERVQRAAVAADEATGRANRTRDRFYRAADFVFDSGPGMDPAAMAQSMAVRVFTDAAGNPIIDPETGQPTEVNATTLWQAVKGQTFDMGALSIPRAPGRRPARGQARAGRGGADDARLARLDQVSGERRRFITPSMAMAMLGSMDDDDVIKLQQQLWEAGLFGETPPSWGIADQATRLAYMELFGQASLTPNETIDRVLNRLQDEAVTRGLNGAGAGVDEEIPAFKPEVASAESLKGLIDDIAQDLLGRFATDEEKSKLVSQLQTREIDTQRAQYDRDIAAGAAGGVGGGASGGGIDAFMAAISSTESGGNYQASNDIGVGHYGKYQISNSNWGRWAERAGLGRGAPKTPENQELVARTIMLDYYRQFGNWRDVAIAWFAGPDDVGKPGSENKRDVNMSVREYADRAVNRMAQFAGQGGGVGGTAGQGFAPIETWDPAAEAEAALKAADPAGWQGHQFADRAVEFYGLLGGLV